MAHEYPRINDFFFQLQDLPPQASHYTFPYELQPHATAQPAYELTAAAGVDDASAAACAEVAGAGAVLAVHPHSHTHTHPHPLPLAVPHPQLQHLQLAHPHPQPHPQQHDAALSCKRRITQNFTAGFDLANCDVVSNSSTSTATTTTRKRKPSPYSTCSTYDDDGSEDTRSNRSTIPDKRQNHSEIEKRRRDKMNNYIIELSTMIPMCSAMSRKLDKLSVLRMAVQHMRSIRGTISMAPLMTLPRPAFLSERDLNAMVLKAAKDCFLVVVGCDRGRLLYVSASVTQMLQYDKAELLGQSLFDILHPKDVAKVKEQLSSSDLSPRDRLIDAKTMLPVKADVAAGASRLCPGARRSFFCRIKCRAATVITAGPSCTVTSATLYAAVKEEAEPPSKPHKKHADKKYCVVQFTGYLKAWAPAHMDGAAADDGDACNLSCLVALGRCLGDLLPREPPAPTRRLLQFTSRHTNDSKFVFVDQRVTLALGFLPQELLGTSLYEHVSAAELGAVAQAHKAALLQRDALKTPPYNFKKKDGSFVRIQTHFKPFNNPWTKDVECLIANNTVVTDKLEPLASDDCSYGLYDQSAPFSDPLDSGLSEADEEMQRLIDSQVESHKIGSTIAEEALRRSSVGFTPDLPLDLLQDTLFVQQPSLMDNLLDAEPPAPPYEHPVRNNVPLSAAGAAATPPPADGDLPASPPLDGNGEATMAVIMSLLEADAGLGGPVNLSSMPWPLP